MLPSPLLMTLAVLPTIWVVDAANGPGTNFTDLPPAVAAAVSGDTIIVRAGYYLPFNVSGKALTIRGAGGAVAHVAGLGAGAPSNPGTTIDAVPAGSTFYVSGLSFTGWGGTGAPSPPMVSVGLSILGATSKVVISDAMITGSYAAGAGGNGLVISGGAEVHVSRTTIYGGGGGGLATGGYGGSGAVVFNGCTLIADQCTFVGGGAGFFAPFSAGGRGIEVSGIASLARCNVYGGTSLGGTSGDAVRVGSGFVRIAGWIANVIQGGGGLAGTPGYALYAYQGGSIVVHGVLSILPVASGVPLASGSVVAGPALPYLAMTGTSTPAGDLDATQPVTVAFDGAIPSAPFACIVDLAPSFSTAFAPLALGELLVSATAPSVLTGTLDALGQFSVTLTPAASAPALVGVPFYAQFGVYDATAGQIRLSNGQIRVFQ